MKVLSTKRGIHATGKRKTAIARIWLKPGQGAITVNKRDMNDYFIRDTSKMMVMQAFEITDTVGKYDVFINVRGGGLTGQAGAIRCALAHALSHGEPDRRKVLKSAELITRDSRKKERKMYGMRGSRRRYQFSKR